MEKGSNINNSLINKEEIKSDIYTICDYIIGKTSKINKNKIDNDKIRMTTKRLQLIVYFSYVNYMIKMNGNKTMFKDEWYAWGSGPVIPDVCFSYDKYKNGEMAPLNNNWEKCILSTDIKESIADILKLTNSIKDVKILKDNACIKGGPWEQVYDCYDPYHDQVITDSSIYEFYKRSNCQYINKKRVKSKDWID